MRILGRKRTRSHSVGLWVGVRLFSGCSRPSDGTKSGIDKTQGMEAIDVFQVLCCAVMNTNIKFLLR